MEFIVNGKQTTQKQAIAKVKANGTIDDVAKFEAIVGIACILGIVKTTDSKGNQYIIKA